MLHMAQGLQVRLPSHHMDLEERRVDDHTLCCPIAICSPPQGVPFSTNLDFSMSLLMACKRRRLILSQHQGNDFQHRLRIKIPNTPIPEADAYERSQLTRTSIEFDKEKECSSCESINPVACRLWKPYHLVAPVVGFRRCFAVGL